MSVWATASLLKSPGLFLEFWPISTMLQFGWSPLVLLFPSPPMRVKSVGDCTKRANYNCYHRHFFFHCLCSIVFFHSLAKSRYLSLFSLSFSFTLCSAGTAKSTIRQILFFLLAIIRSGHLAEIRISIFISKSLIWFSRTDSGSCIYHLRVMSISISFTIPNESLSPTSCV